MVISEATMTEYIDRFLNTRPADRGDTNSILVGGIVGSSILQIALKCAVSAFSTSGVLLLDGCVDNVNMASNKLANVIAYSDILYSLPIYPEITNIVTWKDYENQFNARKYRERYNRHISLFDKSKFNGYSCIIVNNAQLINRRYIQGLLSNFDGPVIFVADMFEDPWCDIRNTFYEKDIPIVIECYDKLSPLKATARKLFGVETRYIDKNAKGGLKYHNRYDKRALGKFESTTMWFSTNPKLIDEVRQDQMEESFKKGYKCTFMMSGEYGNNCDIIYDTFDVNGKRHTMTTNSILVVSDPEKGYVKEYGTNNIYQMDLMYGYRVPTDFIPQNKVPVIPANIMDTHMLNYHNYKSATLIAEEYNPSKSTLYGLMKHSINATLIQGKKMAKKMK